MSSSFSYDVLCLRCGNRGHVFWREYGHHDQHDQITSIWGEFVELPPDPVKTLFHNACGQVVCRRCGQAEACGPRRHITYSTPDQPPDQDLAVVTSYVTIAPSDSDLVVRIYQRGELAAEARLTPRRAVLMAQDALNGAVAVGYRALGSDPQELKRAG